MIQAMPKDLRNMPAESLHLHIKDFELTFATNTRPSESEMTFASVRRALGKVLFVQVHLIEVR